MVVAGIWAHQETALLGVADRRGKHLIESGLKVVAHDVDPKVRDVGRTNADRDGGRLEVAEHLEGLLLDAVTDQPTVAVEGDLAGEVPRLTPPSPRRPAAGPQRHWVPQLGSAVRLALALPPHVDGRQRRRVSRGQ
jgi:hypothetical protein